MKGTRNARKESLEEGGGGPMARDQGDCDGRRKGVGNTVPLVLLLTEQSVHGR